jgi:hypothetical protein
MNRLFFFIVAVLVFMAASTATARGQAEQSTQQTQAAAPAQTKAQNSAADPSSQTPQKRVWTNEDLRSLDSHAGVSTVGRQTDNTIKHVASAKNHDARWYQDQIAKLQAKIPALDRQIAELQAGLDGKPTGDAKKSVRPYGVKADDWSRELAELQKKRDDTITQISALQDQARHNGVAPNALP